MPTQQILVLSSGVCWLVIVTGNTLFVTPRDEVIFTFANQSSGGHNVRIILHAFSLLVVARSVTVMNVNYSAPSYETGAKRSIQR